MNIGTFFSMNHLYKNVNCFFPDPWTSSSLIINKKDKFVHKTLSTFINNNSSNKIKIKDYINLFYILFRFIRVKKFLTYLRLILKSFKNKYYKAIFLDFFSIQILKKYYKNKNFNLSLLFLNGGAHIQHHYLMQFNTLINLILILIQIT